MAPLKLSESFFLLFVIALRKSTVASEIPGPLCKDEHLVRTPFGDHATIRDFYNQWQSDSFMKNSNIAYLAYFYNKWHNLPCGIMAPGIDILKPIIAGKVAPDKTMPWISRLKIDKQPCMGSLISDQWVITAAHCFPTPRPRKPTIVELGRVKSSGKNAKDTFQERVEAKEFIIHPNFTARRFVERDDVALIRLSKPVRFTDRIYPICLPKAYDIVFDVQQLKCYMAGYGATERKKLLASDQLNYLRIALQYWAQCQKEWGSHIFSNNNICGYPYHTAHSSMCFGDSGGPLMCDLSGLGPVRRYYLVGIASYTQDYCYAYPKPNAFVRVSHVVHWIKKEIKARDKTLPWWWEIPVTERLGWGDVFNG